jgi:multidrug transporter EmrE-like cation transporter
MSQPSQLPGWYPDPSNPQKQVYWDGTSWSPPKDIVAPAPTGTDTTNKSKQTAIAIGVCVLSVIGLVISQQSVSLFTGTGSLWTGVGIAAAGTAAAFFLGAAKWVRVVAALCLVFALINVIYVEKQMSEKRNELSEIFDN